MPYFYSGAILRKVDNKDVVRLIAGAIATQERSIYNVTMLRTFSWFMYG